MKYLKIIFVKKNEGKRDRKQDYVVFLNAKSMSSIEVKDGWLNVNVANGLTKNMQSEYSIFLLETNSGNIFRFLKQSGFKIARRYF